LGGCFIAEEVGGLETATVQDLRLGLTGLCGTWCEMGEKGVKTGVEKVKKTGLKRVNRAETGLKQG
jgi:hypothetical protein